MKIYLLRNAETELDKKDIISGSQNSKLTKNGEEQSDQLGEYFKNKRISHIYTSTMKSSKDTAKRIMKRFTKKPKLSSIKEFNERNLGFFEGKRWEVISIFYKEYLFKDENKILKTVLEQKNGETWLDLSNRVIPRINKILEKDTGDIIIIGHLDINRELLKYMGNMTEKERYRVWQNNACINLIEYENETFDVKLINYILGFNG